MEQGTKKRFYSTDSEPNETFLQRKCADVLPNVPCPDNFSNNWDTAKFRKDFPEWARLVDVLRKEKCFDSLTELCYRPDEEYFFPVGFDAKKMTEAEVNCFYVKILN